MIATKTRKKDSRKVSKVYARLSSNPTSGIAPEFLWWAGQARAPRWRTMREFAEQEIVIPTGPFARRHFTCDRQPFNRLWFDAVDSGMWSRFWATGPSQATKTLTCFIIPILYHLFELGETVICGLPDMDMAGDKWDRDLLPVIGQSPRYKDLLPTKGPGSRGGHVEAITFGNGATLKFMSGGGRDKSRAHYTSRILVITEADALDESGLGSVEADKIKQLQARLRSFGDKAVQYGECTLTTCDGRTYREIENGTQSRIVLPCPHCRQYVVPEREHVQGWQDAADEIEAAVKAHFCCPDCGKPWTEDQRIAANHACRLVHRGQTIDRAGRIRGAAPRTRTLGFRWSAVHNLFRTTGDLGVDLWKAQRDAAGENADPENVEKELCQFVFAVPYRPPRHEAAPLSVEGLTKRTGELSKGAIPDWADFVTVGVDLHKRLGYWVVLASRSDGASHIPDYGRLEIASDDLGVEAATLSALRELRERVFKGWPMPSAPEGYRVPDQVWMDSGWAEQTETVYQFCREPETVTPGRVWNRFWPTKGYGFGQDRTRFYRAPQKTGPVVVCIGTNYHISRLKAQRTYLVEVDANYWKSFVHERLSVEIPEDHDRGQAFTGAMTLFYSLERNEHVGFSAQLTSEKQIVEFVAGKGSIRRWVKIGSRNNHYLDALYLAGAAGHFCGVRVIKDPVPRVDTSEPTTRSTPLTTPDGRPYLITERGRDR